MLARNKSGVSEMIAYVLLVVIAIGLSAGVYTFLKVFVPKEKVECPDDIKMIIQSATCDTANKLLNLEISNRGYFYIPNIYVRFGAEGRKVLDQLNEDKTNLIVDLGCEKDTEVAPDTAKPCRDGKGLKPGSSFDVNLALGEVVPGDYTIEIQPAVVGEKGIVAICPNAVTTQKVVC